MGECFFWYRPTRVPVVPDQRPLNSGVASIWRYGHRAQVVLEKLDCSASLIAELSIAIDWVNNYSCGVPFSDSALTASTSANDTRCYFNVRSKADISRLNLPHNIFNE